MLWTENYTLEHSPSPEQLVMMAEHARYALKKKYREIAADDFLNEVKRTVLGIDCSKLLLITYGLILLQQLMEEQNMLSKAEKNLCALEWKFLLRMS